ncbi:MAG: glycosyltransferase family 4 protein [Desulfuromonadaceae bacterium]|nr:glycosyltransferase family 4 protein [Desulfuromonadaceae bacterium]
MKILIASTLLSETRGGVALVSRLLARTFIELGHEVRILTRCPDSVWELSGVDVKHHPPKKEIWNSFRWADGVIAQGPCLTICWPLLFLKRKTLLVYHILPDLRKIHQLAVRLMFRSAKRYGVSRFIAEQIVGDVIPNPFDDALYGNYNEQILELGRPLDLVFVGRLTSEKGIFFLMEVMRALAERSVFPSLTIIGDSYGPGDVFSSYTSEPWWSSVRILGHLSQKQITSELRQHKVLVVPSLWNEPFGIVALEGLASGCVVIASDRGGLPEAVGSHGVVVRVDDEVMLVDAIEQILSEPEKRRELLLGVDDFLVNHTCNTVACCYFSELT